MEEKNAVLEELVETNKIIQEQMERIDGLIAYNIGGEILVKLNFFKEHFLEYKLEDVGEYGWLASARFNGMQFETLATADELKAAEMFDIGKVMHRAKEES